MTRRIHNGNLQESALFLLLIAVLVVFSGCSSQAKEARYLESGKKLREKKDYARATLQFRNAAQVNPADAEPYYQLGLTEIARGSASSAYAYFARAVALNPKHGGAQLKMAELLASSSNQEEVRKGQERAQAILTASPDNPDVLDALAITELRLGEREEALRHLQQAIQKVPKHLKSSVTLAWAKLEQGDKAAAEQILKQAVEHAPRSEEAGVVLASFYLMMGKTAEGERELRRVLQMNPNNAPALLDLATMQFAAGQKEQAERTYKQLSVSPEKRYGTLYAVFLFQNGKRDAAITEFKRLAKQDPNDLDARSRLVTAYIAASRLADADKVLAAALRHNPRDSRALLQRSEISLMAGMYTEAQAQLAEVLRYYPDSAPAHYLLARVHQARGAPLNQRQELNEALRLNPNLLAVRVQLARSFLAANDARAALDLLEKAPEVQKRTLSFIEQRNWDLLALGDHAKLRKGIDQGFALARTRGLLMQDALLQLRQNNYAGARRLLEEVLKQNPEDVVALEVLAASYVAQKQIPVALEKVREYAALRPKSAPLQYLLGRWLLDGNKPAEARVAFIRAKAADPKFTLADLALAAMDREAGRLDNAREILSRLLSGKPAELPARLQLGYLEAKAGNYATAIEHWRKVLEADRNNVVALNNLAYLLAEYGNQPDEALKHAQQAKELAPNNFVVEGTIGWVYYRKGIYSAALQHLENAVAREGNAVIEGTAVRKYHLAMAYLRSGRRQKGLQTLEAAVKLDPNLPEAQTAQELMLENRR